MEILSPLTSSKNVKKILDIEAQNIVDLYKKDYGIRVDSHFRNCDAISIYRCLDTNLMFYHPVVVGDGVFYEQLQELGWYYPSWKWENQYVASFIKPESEILEIGCGDGHFLSKMLSDKKIVPTGIELNQQAAQNLMKKGIEVVSETVEEYAKVSRKRFDVVCCFQVLEHVPNPLEFVESCCSLLKKGGILAFAVPNNTPFLYGYDVFHTLNLPPHHQTLWNKASLNYLSTIFPLEILKIEAEPIDVAQIAAYIESYRKFFGRDSLGYFLMKNFLPKRLWKFFAYLMKMKGRNIVAVYKKK
ncbi:MAG: hypothetical protein OHK0045_02870 [Raineya sp.]